MKKIINRSIVIFITFFATTVYSAGLTVVGVEAMGTGMTFGEAVNSALIEAISQVNGKSIDSTRISQSLTSSTVEGIDESYFSSDKYLSVVKEATKGAVSSYTILDESQEGNIWSVTLEVRVSKYKTSKSANRKRIVIVPSQVKGDSYSLSGKSHSRTSVSNKLAQTISDALVQTRKWSVLDRRDSKAMDQELALAASDQSSVSEKARIGVKLVSDYVLIPEIDSFAYSIQKKKMKLSDRTYEVGYGSVSVSYRLIEVATSQLVYSDTITSKFDQNDFNRSERNNSAAIASSMIDDVSIKLVKKLNSQIYPLSIISRLNEQVILSEGGKTVSVGEVYRVYKRGGKLYDPYTKEFMGYEESPCCSMKITRVAPKQAYGVILTGNELIPSEIPNNMFVVRGKIASKTKPVVIKTTIKEEDSDW